MPRNYTEEIKELNRDYVHIKNKENLNTLINEIVEGGFSKLQAVFDFDHTISKQTGLVSISSFGLFNLCPSVTDEYRNVKAALKTKYACLEHDPAIPLSKRREYMEEWYELSEKALIGQMVPRQEIDDVVAKSGPPLRDGTVELFDALYKADVPVLVFSAGLGDVVESVLKHFNILHPNVKVISNFLKYDENGKIQGFVDDLIHIYKKNEYALKDSEYFEVIKNRDNVILLGDALGDAGMADGISHSNAVLKIGFLFMHVEDNLLAYKDAFDIVLVDDQSMDIVRSIINCMH